MKGKKITDATGKEKKDASGWYYDMERDPKLEKAINLVERLGLGGYWDGYHLSIKTVYEEL